MRKILITLAGAMFAVAMSTTGANAALNSVELNVITKTNEVRADAGAKRVQNWNCLERYAERHATWMAKNKKLQHQSSAKFKTIMKECKLNAIGENIASGYSSSSSVVAGWKNSPGHYKNMVNTRYDKIGVAYVKASNGTRYWIQIFGTRVR